MMGLFLFAIVLEYFSIHLNGLYVAEINDRFTYYNEFENSRQGIFSKLFRFLGQQIFLGWKDKI